jgi:ABC-type polysaccharide/polyol phosphate export permease
VKKVANYVQEAVRDVISGLKHHDVWLMLAWSEIRQRYRRSTLGPFWLTLSMAVTIGGMGPLYGRLFGQDISTYISFLAVGMVTWSLISGIVTDSSNGFIASEGFIKEFNLPLSVYVLRVIWRNLIIFAHNMVVVIVVLIAFPPQLGWSIALFPIALLAIAINGVSLGLLLGTLCTRFRDVQQIVMSTLMIIFFLTPIMWRPSMLGQKAWLLNFNPAYFFIESTRAPLLGDPINSDVWIGVAVTTVLLALLAAVVYGKYRFRIAYWV